MPTHTERALRGVSCQPLVMPLYWGDCVLCGGAWGVSWPGVFVSHTPCPTKGGGGTLIAKHKAGEIWMKRRDCDWRFIYFDFSQKGHGSGWVAGLSTLSIPPKIVTTMELKCSPKSTNHIAETREPVLRVWSPFSLFNPLYNGQLNEWFSERFKAHFYCWTTGAKVSKQGGEEGYVGKKV